MSSNTNETSLSAGTQTRKAHQLLTFIRRGPTIPALIIITVILCAIFAPYLAPHDPQKIDPKARLTPPAWSEGGSGKYLLGTDSTGRDLLSRIIYGARVSLIVAVIGISISATLGTILGLTSGFFGGITDMFIMRIVDVMMSLPVLFLALAFASVIPSGMYIIILIVAFFGWSHYTRITRGEVLSLKERDFVALARVAQASQKRIMLKHILPNPTNTLTVLVTLDVGGVIMFEAAFSFIGFGVQPPTPSWGNILSEGQNYLTTAWWIATFPGLALMAMVFSCNFIGDWLRDALDPKLRQL
ncbi:MAG: ABC transporter permease [Deltaproteobacteria bacterium]|nr:ABC transporter permease [Deltaproteobacteria bacterium]MBW2141225.1 ABC transporter permease [Deltaproteobacteria bacterium]MBW2323607.1 ABC transporter permease [Deltaproteobacteria bacterium]